jgi:hypothetical protein
MITAEQLELQEVQARATQAKWDANKLEALEAAEAREREQKAKALSANYVYKCDRTR